MEPEVQLSEREFKALSAANRIAILKLLKEKNHNPTEIAAKLGIAIPSVQKHLDILVASDMIERIEDDRKWVFYRLTRKGGNLIMPDRVRLVLMLAIAGLMVFGVVGVLWFVQNSPAHPGPPGAGVILSTPMVTSTNQVVLTWQLESGLENVSFEIQRRELGETEFRTISSDLKETAFTDSTVEAEKSYEYRVSVRNGGNGETMVSSPSISVTIPKLPVIDQSNGQIVTPDDSDPGETTGPPDLTIGRVRSFWVNSVETEAQVVTGFEDWPDFKVSKTTGAVVIFAWQMAHETPAVFEIRRKGPDGSYVTIADSVNEPFFVDGTVQPGVLYSFQVRATDGGQTGPWSDLVDVSGS